MTKTNCYIVSTIHTSNKIPDKWIYNGIKKASGSPFTHTQVVFSHTGELFESAHPDGAQRRYDYVFNENNINKKRQYTIRDLTEMEILNLRAYFDFKEIIGTRYATLKLLLYLAISKTKPFWNKIGFSPMSLDAVWGEFCSAYIDNAFKYAGIDLLPGNLEEFTSPGDIVNSDFLQQIED